MFLTKSKMYIISDCLVGKGKERRKMIKNKLISLLIGVAFVCSLLPGVFVSASVISNEDGTVTLRPIDATYVSQHGDDYAANFYGSSVMKVNYTNSSGGLDEWGQYGYLKFDVSDIAKERIASAKLRVYVEDVGDPRASTREIGIFDASNKDWDGKSLTWSSGQHYSKSQLGSFTVTADGSKITDAGWREIDITEYMRNNIEDTLSFIAKMTSTRGHYVTISSGTYSGNPKYFDDRLYNKNMPQLEVDYCAADAAEYSRTVLTASKDTYVDQHNPRVNYINNEYLQVNFTDSETRGDRYGSYSYLDFDMSEIDSESLSSARLWVYVDPSSDTRDSTRTIGVFEPSEKWSDNITWSNKRVSAKGEAIAEYTVSGNSFDIIDYGWKCVDVTDYVKNVLLKTNAVSFMMKAVNSNAHPVLIRSSEYSDEATRPKLVINNEQEISDFDFRTEYSNETVLIEGSTGIRGSKQVLIRIFDPNNDLKVIDQIASDVNGHYKFNYNLQGALNGTYQIFVSVEGNENIKRAKLDVGNATDISVIYPDPVSTILKPEVNVSSSCSYLTNNKVFSIYSTMEQNNKNIRTQNISTVIALYNNDGTMYNYSAGSIEAQPDNEEQFGSDILLPNDVTGMTLKVFTLEGKNIYSGSMIPLSKPYCINRTEPYEGEGSLLETPVEPLFIKDVVFPEYADKFSVYDISYYYGHEKAYYEKLILPGQMLTISGKVKNKQSEDVAIGEAFFTQIDGESQFVKLQTWYKIKPGETRTVSWDVPSEWTAYPPEGDPVYPDNWISDEGGLTTENQDYFGNNIKESVLVEKDSFIKGQIDSENDVDCVKFVAPTTGYYEIANIDGINVKAELFAENLVDPSDPLNGFEKIYPKDIIDGTMPETRWCGYLEEGNTYAIRFTPKIKGNTGAYTCTISVDTDEDGLVDIWEITKDIDGDGIEDIPGADPYKSDIYVEINWMKGFKPSQEALNIVSEAFANSGAGYKDKGINLHNVWGEETAHTAVLEFNSKTQGDEYDLDTVIEGHFTNKLSEYAYHYALFGDRYVIRKDADNDDEIDDTSSGYSSYGWGQVIFIAMGSTYSYEELLTPYETAGTYMHELGHNLELYHGGADDINYKPNYLSVMNYAFQFDGLKDESYDSTKNYDYSRYVLPELNEESLIESDGFDKEGLGSVK